MRHSWTSSGSRMKIQSLTWQYWLQPGCVFINSTQPTKRTIHLRTQNSERIKSRNTCTFQVNFLQNKTANRAWTSKKPFTSSSTNPSSSGKTTSAWSHAVSTQTTPTIPSQYSLCWPLSLTATISKKPLMTSTHNSRIKSTSFTTAKTIWVDFKFRSTRTKWRLRVPRLMGFMCLRARLFWSLHLREIWSW